MVDIPAVITLAISSMAVAYFIIRVFVQGD